jgi:hypothetical protein
LEKNWRHHFCLELESPLPLENLSVANQLATIKLAVHGPVSETSRIDVDLDITLIQSAPD